jgi:hypothetical protein
MEVGRLAPRHERMALLYPRSEDLQSCMCEYFIVVVNLCHKLLKFTKKSSLGQFKASVADGDLKSSQSKSRALGHEDQRRNANADGRDNYR